MNLKITTKDQENNQILILAAILIAAMTFFLDATAYSLIRMIASSTMDAIMLLLSNSEIIALFFLLASALLFKKTRHFLILWTSIATTAIIVTAIKLIIERPRPEHLQLFLFGLPDYSFPSMHTALLFSTAYILLIAYPKQKAIFLSYATLVGISRIYLGVHHLSDVAFGGLIGFLIGYYTFQADETHDFLRKVYKKKSRKNR